MMANPFLSFWMGGYECSDQLNYFGDRMDLLEATRHIDYLDIDYQLLGSLRMHTVREGVQWSRVERRPYCYDWLQVKGMIHTADKNNVQIIWDLCHFGYPDDLSPLHPHFCKRFVAFTTAFVKMYRSIHPDGDLILTPVNEVNFISWLGGEIGATVPYTRGYGWEVKYKLMEAYIQAVKAMKCIDDRIIVLTTEPLINIIPENSNDLNVVASAREKNEEQFQMLDILCGYTCPELGGNPDLADIIGCNYYHNNQWLYPSEKQLDWRNASGIYGYKSLSALCGQVYKRYGKPIVITETSYEGEEKSRWIRFIAEECTAILNREIPLWGICIYPVLNRPDWDFPEKWHNSGIWEIDTENHERTTQDDYVAELKKCMKLLTASGTQVSGINKKTIAV